MIASIGIKNFYIIVASTLIAISGLTIVIVAVTSSTAQAPLSSPTESPTQIPTESPSGTPSESPTESPRNPLDTTRPNIVFILTDDLGTNMVDTPQGRELGLYDGREQSVKTPELYRLASEGIFFQRNLASTPVCMPSRYAFLTGISAGSKWSRIRGNTGTGSEGFINTAGETTVAQELKQRAYATAMFGKFHFQTPPSEVGFDYSLHMSRFTNGNEFPRFFPEVILEDTGSGNVERRDLTPLNNALGIKTYDQENTKCTREGDKCEYAPDIYHRKSLEWMQAQIDSNIPFFVYLPMLEPHDGKRASSAGFNTLPVPRIDGPVEDYSDSKYDGYFGRMKNLASAVTNYVDVRVGEIRDFLIENHVESNTLVIFTSDNGATDSIATSNTQSNQIFSTNGGYKANHPYRGQKRHLLFGGSSVPTIAWFQGLIQPGSTLNHLTDMSDLTKTILDIAGVATINPQFNGVSLVNALKGNVDNRLVNREFIFNEICLNDLGELGRHRNCDFMISFTSGQCTGMRIEWTARTNFEETIRDRGSGFTNVNGNLTLSDLGGGYVPFCSNFSVDITESSNLCNNNNINSDRQNCIDLAKNRILGHRVVPTNAEIEARS